MLPIGSIIIPLIVAPRLRRCFLCLNILYCSKVRFCGTDTKGVCPFIAYYFGDFFLAPKVSNKKYLPNISCTSFF